MVGAAAGIALVDKRAGGSLVDRSDSCRRLRTHGGCAVAAAVAAAQRLREAEKAAGGAWLFLSMASLRATARARPRLSWVERTLYFAWAGLARAINTAATQPAISLSSAPTAVATTLPSPPPPPPSGGRVWRSGWSAAADPAETIWPHMEATRSSRRWLRRRLPPEVEGPCC